MRQRCDRAAMTWSDCVVTAVLFMLALALLVLGVLAAQVYAQAPLRIVCRDSQGVFLQVAFLGSHAFHVRADLSGDIVEGICRIE